MTALDLSAFATSQDSPDVAALKTKVWEVAETYTTKHGWCKEVRKALAECGIVPETKVTVIVTTTHPFVFNTSVYPSKLAGLDEDGQKAVLAEALGEMSLTGGIGVTGSFTLPAASIVSMALKLPLPDDVKDVIEDDNVWGYISREGRLRHALRSTAYGTTPAVTRTNDNGAVRLMSRDAYTACGKTVYEATMYSARGTDNHCRTCAAKVASEASSN